MILKLFSYLVTEDVIHPQMKGGHFTQGDVMGGLIFIYFDCGSLC